MTPELLATRAKVQTDPERVNGGIRFGGNSVLSIGSFTVDFGRGVDAKDLAVEIAARWNAGRTAYSDAAKLSQ